LEYDCIEGMAIPLTVFWKEMMHQKVSLVWVTPTVRILHEHKRVRKFNIRGTHNDKNMVVSVYNVTPKAAQPDTRLR
jgi:hypothetical protein